MGDNQSDNSIEWDPKKDVFVPWNQIVGGTSPTVTTTTVSCSNFSTTFPASVMTEIENVTGVRLSSQDDGRGFIVIDINKIPTYRIELNKKAMNSILHQIIFEKNNE
jgi:hypothetical protein